MKYLSKYKIFESVKKDIEAICDKYGITNYTINSDGSIDVEGSVSLNEISLTKIPIKFGVVSGTFYCYNNNLTSFENFPRVINESLFAHCNEITSLENLPDVKGSIYLYQNKIKTLVGGPKKINGDLYLHKNKLESLEGSIEEIVGDFSCYENKLTSVKGNLKKVGETFNCSKNKITSLEGCPDVRDLLCQDNEITSLKGSPKKVDGLYCHNNKITSLEYCPKLDSIVYTGNPVYEVTKQFMSQFVVDPNYLIEFFNDTDIIQGDKIIYDRLAWFYSEIECPVNMNDILAQARKYYIISH